MGAGVRRVPDVRHVGEEPGCVHKRGLVRGRVVRRARRGGLQARQARGPRGRWAALPDGVGGVEDACVLAARLVGSARPGGGEGHASCELTRLMGTSQRQQDRYCRLAELRGTSLEAQKPRRTKGRAECQKCDCATSSRRLDGFVRRVARSVTTITNLSCTSSHSLPQTCTSDSAAVTPFRTEIQTFCQILLLG